MKALYTFVACVLVFVGLTGSALAGIKVVVDKSDQVMHVYQDGAKVDTWAVSTGEKDHWTPNGTFGVQFLSEHHRSSKYNNAPMPYSIFFNGDIAIHGTTEVGMLGNRASHGCVRLKTSNAKKLFNLVRQGHQLTIIVRS